MSQRIRLANVEEGNREEGQGHNGGEAHNNAGEDSSKVFAVPAYAIGVSGAFGLLAFMQFPANRGASKVRLHVNLFRPGRNSTHLGQ